MTECDEVGPRPEVDERPGPNVKEGCIINTSAVTYRRFGVAGVRVLLMVAASRESYSAVLGPAGVVVASPNQRGWTAGTNEFRTAIGFCA